MLQVCGWGVFVSMCGVGLGISYLRSDPEIFFAAVFSALLGVMPLFMVMAAKQRRLQTDLYIAILPLLLPTLDKWSIVTRQPAPQIARMPGHYLVPRDKTDCDFHIEGSLRGVPFSVTQAVLSHSPGDNPETTFRGLIIWTPVSNAFPGDFAALRRPLRERSLWRGTVLPERLVPIPNTTHLGRWAYDFVTTDWASASIRLPGLASAIDALLTLKLEDLPQVAIRGSDAFVLLPLPRFGWDSEWPVRDLDVDRHLRPFASRLVGIIEAIAAVRRV
ncbi:hypothetical protein [Rhizobium glycinendophyticum]|uniref:DUF3137 domain-containing protein n=1 Tax=Rhizobium glycinendophyticum TaxID=2589807 RepID=A0A504V194_9HYPH|nr:hypothetical protein [Rhizobium glycinendophyticum]TPP11182.1 hypothetical protein FJQ55_10285 [Rhizobium glycinendophyticum]